MALTLIPPGARKGNKFFLARGSINNRVHEINTGETDPRKARAFARKYEADVRATPVAGDRITFADAARRYCEFRNPRKDDRGRIDRLVSILGSRFIREIRPADLHEVAMRLCDAGCANATRNREVLRPATTILHHAAMAGLCDYIRIKSFPEPRPVTRALDAGAAADLIAAAQPGPQRLLLIWLFFQGTRITATLKLTWDDIDLDRRTVRMWNEKGKRHEEFPLHEETQAVLAEVETRSGPVFAWSNKSSLRRWLPALCERVGVRFTAHMARHTLGTQLAASGASLATIMKALGHSQASSSLRYQSPDIEVVRAATAKIDYRRRA